MKTILLGAAAALAFASLPGAHAQDSSVDIKAPHTARYHMHGEDFRPYRNIYLLQNGQQIAFKQTFSMLYTQLADGARVRIYATSPTTFVSDSGVRFAFDNDGEAVTISDFQKLPLAIVASDKPIVMASRR